jgi:hypothetical protein
MTPLRLETKTTHYVDSNELARFLTERMGRSVDVFGSSNDTDYSYDVIKSDSDSIYAVDPDEVQKFAETGDIDCEIYEFGPALQYAADQGWLEPGAYVVRVSW